MEAIAAEYSSSAAAAHWSYASTSVLEAEDVEDASISGSKSMAKKPRGSSITWADWLKTYDPFGLIHTSPEMKKEVYAFSGFVSFVSIC